jgi:hypothetical protein
MKMTCGIIMITICILGIILEGSFDLIHTFPFLSIVISICIPFFIVLTNILASQQEKERSTKEDEAEPGS